ncbi:Nicotinate phosphoribosyltransferase [hydrothermal vent metagenome]|uniref:nicotinate phosphoribosyltransferase n=1 Tax=hydrothermal vent metagenome TaxID=652676 RepID=A0A3B0UBD6_9ZZZZ
MSFSLGQIGLYTDYYELSMAQGYFYAGKKNDRVVFDYFFRSSPFNGGFTVFAGLYDLLEILSDYTFSPSDIEYLRSQGFKPGFLAFLKDFSFKGEIFSMAEGEIVFPNEPILRTEGNIIECQLIESLLLNILNFETLIATKAFRVWLASGKRAFSDFGLRRAQGFGALHASRAACIGGAVFTSNVLAGKLFNIPVSGTQAHSWIQSFDDELKAFRVYAEHNPEDTILLVDTFDTLNSGVPNAILVAKEMEKKGQRLKGIRLDSGDLAYFSKKTRKLLDDAGLGYVKIVASNQLNEYVIQSLINEQKAPIDAFGVGTELTTGKPDAALDGVYKLAWVNGQSKMKVSENVEKTTLPGIKNVVRYYDEDGLFFRDGILNNSESVDSVQSIFHPIYPERRTNVSKLKKEPLLKKVLSKGEILTPKINPSEIFIYLSGRADKLPAEHKRFISPHIYKVGVSEILLNERAGLLSQYKSKE